MVSRSELIQNLEPIHFVLIFVGFFALIPFLRLVLLFKETKIREYLLFGFVFLLAAFFTISEVLAEASNELVFWQLSFTFRNLTYFLFFTHTVRMMWARPSELLVYIGVILYSLVQGMIFLWEPLKSIYDDPSLIGAGLVIDNQRLYSTDYRLLGNIFQVYVASLFLYSYLSVKVIDRAPRLKISIGIMRGVGLLLLLSRLTRLVQNFGILDYDIIELIGAVVLLIGFGFIAFIFYYYPGSILVSKAQIAGLIVISKTGMPIASGKFEDSNLSGSSTLLSGIISAVQNVMGTIDEGTRVKEIDAGDRSILVEHQSDIYFMLVADSAPTTILRSSLSYFARTFIHEKENEIREFNYTGKIIQDITEVVQKSFPYTIGRPMEIWP